jgi:hypothetical protein
MTAQRRVEAGPAAAHGEVQFTTWSKLIEPDSEATKVPVKKKAEKKLAAKDAAAAARAACPVKKPADGRVVFCQYSQPSQRWPS